MCALNHNYPQDFKCPDCGALITCLSCAELHAAQLPRGPAFTYDTDSSTSPSFETIAVTDHFDLVEPSAPEPVQPPSVIATGQQPLFI